MASGKKNYFRHYFNARKDEKIRYLMDEFGKEAYFFYFTIVELCAEQASDGLRDYYSFHASVLRQELGLSQRRLNLVLTKMEGRLLLGCTLIENTYEIKMPKLLKYMGKYTTKIDSNVPNKRKEKKRKEKVIEKTFSKKSDPIEPDALAAADLFPKENPIDEKLIYISERYAFMNSTLQNFMTGCSLKILKELIETYHEQDLLREVDRAYDWNEDQPKGKKKKAIGSFLKNWINRSQIEPKSEEAETALENLFEQATRGKDL